MANATELGVDFLTVHGHDLKTLRAAITGRGKSQLKLLAVTVLTNLTADDLKQQGSLHAPADLVLHARQARARIRASTGSSARARRRRASARRWVLGFSS